MTNKLELKSSHEVIDTVDVADVDSIFQGKPTDLDTLTVVMKDGTRLYCDEVCPIDSLQEEPKDKCNGCNNVKSCITCIDGSEWAHLSEELESWDKFFHIDDAIEDYCRYDSHIVFFTESLNGEPLEEADDREQIERAFKAGAKWQKQQMMKDAVDGRFSYNPNFKENEFICLEKSDTPEHYLGELVKVIIIKQEEE